MKQSILIPVLSTGFEMNYFGRNNPSHDWLMENNESSEHFSQVENLFRLHRHDVMEILVFLDGECEFFCEGHTYSLRRGDVVVIPPYAVHQAVVKNFDNYERIIISISEHLMDDFISSSPALKENMVYQKTQGSYVMHLHSKNFQVILASLQDILQKKTISEKTYPFSINYLLFQVLQDILDPASSMPNLSNKNELDQRFLAILEYIESNLTDPDLSLANVSNYFHLNKYYFSHYFKKNMSLPFYRYVSLKRLSYAATMIKQNQISIEEIALKCGFSDYSSFYRLFKKEYSLSPKKSQKEFKNL
ncbi:AraC family transcriptional regulator [Paenibacillus sp. FSL H8-0548]|uniref:helix-turn-helix domain-containing protein n=1 Tax=Paenibacillus sp. FSL H8-0548 TaxID=1920422 RepID=UPI00096C3178|nr:AraC family transcriptional regulator [Paenibacillus sp. FSL H8-0548]OMF34660.1 AraC family transcriptional regulator [Paenibacillus sp. FSL H8-0548]